LNIVSNEAIKLQAAPSKFIRFLYNRLVLEQPDVRASAISSLGKIAIHFPELTLEIKQIIKQYAIFSLRRNFLKIVL